MPSYIDLSDAVVARPDNIACEWRISCYPIVLRENRILMVEPVWANRWELPGGGVELAREETLIEAAIWECMEETGYTFIPDPTSLRLTGDQFFSVSAENHYYHSITFTIVGTADGDPSHHWTPIATEIARIEWLDLIVLVEREVHQPHWSALVDQGLIPGI